MSEKELEAAYDRAVEDSCESWYEDYLQNMPHCPMMNQDVFLLELDYRVWQYCGLNTAEMPFNDQVWNWTEEQRKAQPWSPQYATYFYNRAILDGDRVIAKYTGDVVVTARWEAQAEEAIAMLQDALRQPVAALEEVQRERDALAAENAHLKHALALEEARTARNAAAEEEVETARDGLVAGKGLMKHAAEKEKALDALAAENP